MVDKILHRKVNIDIPSLVVVTNREATEPMVPSSKVEMVSSKAVQSPS
jgi:hypothetical protein